MLREFTRTLPAPALRESLAQFELRPTFETPKADEQNADPLRLQRAAPALTRWRESLGYESVSHFIRSFKRRFGQTPGSWARAGS